jgi:hypothetical protein
MYLSIPMCIGKLRHRDEEHHHPFGGKGTTTEPLDGGAFTIGVLALTGKGIGRGATTNIASARLPSCSSHSQMVELERKKRKEEVGKRRGGPPPRCCASAVAGGGLLLRPPVSSVSTRAATGG